MRRLPAISLDPMKFLQAFAAGLPAEFADAIDLAREVRMSSVKNSKAIEWAG
jgi:hypothetical protein